MKKCQRCGDEFRGWAKIDGVLRNLNSRKFCLGCSPFGLHNTSKLPVEGTCEICGKNLVGNQKKYCSLECHRLCGNFKYQNYECQKARGILRRETLIQMMGGSCSRCGYNKCNSSLVFHHLDPAIKEFKLDIRHCSNSSWGNLLAESKKCILLCANCHGEEHWGDTD